MGISKSTEMITSITIMT